MSNFQKVLQNFNEELKFTVYCDIYVARDEHAKLNASKIVKNMQTFLDNVTIGKITNVKLFQQNKSKTFLEFDIDVNAKNQKIVNIIINHINKYCKSLDVTYFNTYVD